LVTGIVVARGAWERSWRGVSTWVIARVKGWFLLPTSIVLHRPHPISFSLSLCVLCDTSLSFILANTLFTLCFQTRTLWLMTLQSGRGSVLLIAPLPIPPDIPQLDSFKLGKAIPPALSNAAPRPGHRHQRSHSRNTSISSSTSLGHTLSSSRSSGLQESSRFSFGSLSSPSSNSTLSSSGSASSLASAGPAPPAGPPSKRNSHHRRLSSVSTRRESAELMGVSLPDLPAPSFEDNVNFGEKDSIRRRALWALEGKPDLSFNKVEIPELTTPVVEKMMFDFCRSSPYHLFVFFSHLSLQQLRQRLLVEALAIR